MDDLRPGDLRVPMPQPFVGPHDVAVSPDTRRPSGVGRRFNFDVSEEVLSEIGRYALEHAIAEMGHAVANLYRSDVEAAVFRFLTDKVNRDWVEPYVRDAVRTVVFSILNDATMMSLEEMERRENVTRGAGGTGSGET